MRSKKTMGAGALVLAGLAVAGVVYLATRDDAEELPEDFDRSLASAAAVQNEEPGVVAGWLAMYRLGFTDRFLRPGDSAYNAQILADGVAASGLAEGDDRRACRLYMDRLAAGTLRPIPVGSPAANATLERASAFLQRTCTETLAVPSR